MLSLRGALRFRRVPRPESPRNIQHYQYRAEHRGTPYLWAALVRRRKMRRAQRNGLSDFLYRKSLIPCAIGCNLPGLVLGRCRASPMSRRCSAKFRSQTGRGTGDKLRPGHRKRGSMFFRASPSSMSTLGLPSNNNNADLGAIPALGRAHVPQPVEGLPEEAPNAGFE